MHRTAGHLRPCDVTVHADLDTGGLRHLGISGTVMALPGQSVDSIGVALDDGNAFVGGQRPVALLAVTRALQPGRRSGRWSLLQAAGGG
jgi:hypothetical protein